jgi:hypothetical protein
MKELLGGCRYIEFPRTTERSGSLTPIESFKDIPFEINRVFYLYDIPGGENRGGHAHKECHQLLIAASGAFDAKIDDGKHSQIIRLDRPYYGVYVPPGVWAEELNFSSGSICLVFASHPYDEADYIRDYKRFLSYAENLRRER